MLTFHETNGNDSFFIHFAWECKTPRLDFLQENQITQRFINTFFGEKNAIFRY